MVLFDDGSSSTIPVTRIVESASRILKVGETVEVQWSDKAIYEATIQALGNQKDMEELIDALQGEEGSADEEDHETDEEIQKGCWLGNPAATDAKQRVWTTRTTPDKLASAEFTAKNAPKLALNLMRALFSDDKLVNGCCTPSPSGYKILDQTIISGIRSNMNAKCRSLRSRSPKFVKVQPTVFDATHDDGGCRAVLRDAAHDDGGCHAAADG
ncbi:hypothetical protein EMCRGX_G027401 [Ephydatia muelleri]